MHEQLSQFHVNYPCRSGGIQGANAPSGGRPNVPRPLQLSPAEADHNVFFIAPTGAPDLEHLETQRRDVRIVGRIEVGPILTLDSLHQILERQQQQR